MDEIVKPADRYLSPSEATKMVELIMVALRSKNYVRRADAAFLLGHDIGHVAVIPLLKAIAMDVKEHKCVRAQAVRGIAHVPDKKVVPLLIQLLEMGERERNEEVSSAAWVMLKRLIDYDQAKEDPNKSRAENIRIQWEQVKDKINMREQVRHIKLFPCSWGW